MMSPWKKRAEKEEKEEKEEKRDDLPRRARRPHVGRKRKTGKRKTWLQAEKL
jgi:hypothetical protein